MKILTYLMILASLVILAIFSIFRPLFVHLIPNFYPLPWTAILTGIIAIVFSYTPGKTNRITWAFYGAAMSWLALVMAIVIDHTCPEGFLGFPSLACLMSIRYLTTMRELAHTDIKTDKIGIAQVVLIQTGIALFLFAIIWSLYAPAH